MNLMSLVSAWGSALLAFLWQGAVIGVTSFLLLKLFRHARPQVRYGIACFALAACLALPLSAVWHSMSNNASDATAILMSETVSDVEALQDVAGPQKASPVAVMLDEQIPWIVITWSLGCAFFSLRMAMGLSWISRARRRSLASADRSLQSKLNLLAIQFGVSRPIQLLVCKDIDSPVTAGWWKPMVLIPAALASRLPPDCIEALLAHELAHIKRYDYLINLIQSVIEAVLFFHPVVWWLSRQIRIERENIADDLAAEVLGEPRQLALALAALDEFQMAGPLLAPAAQGGNLMSRIQRLIKPTEHVLGWKMSAILVVLAMACITVYAHDKTSATPKAADPVAAATAAADAVTAANAVAAADAADSEASAADAATLAADSETSAADSATSAADSEVSAAEAVESADEVNEVEEADRAADENDRVSLNNTGNHQTYALVIEGKDGMLLSGSIDDIKKINGIRKNIKGDFLWFRRDGKAYIVQDPVVLAEVKAAWKDSDKLSAQMEALSAKMEVHSKVMEGLGAKMEAVSERGNGSHEAMDKTGREMEALGRQQEAIGRQMESIGEKLASAKTDAQRESMDREMRIQEQKMAVLSRQMESLSAIMQQHSAKLENDMKPMEALGREMEVASKPMEALGQQMSVLGKQQEALSRQAEKKVLNIIDGSLKNGQARPLGSLAP